MKTRIHQQGIVLLVSLVLLLMLTITAITAASQSNLQLRISSNSQQQAIAFQAAESGLQRWTKDYFGLLGEWHPSKVGEITESKELLEFDANAISNSERSIPIQSGFGMNSGPYVVKFDIRSVGQACDTDGNCNATAIHRQGVQNRYIP